MPKAFPGSSNIWHGIAGTVVAVTHDRYFLDNVAQWILEIDRGKGIPLEGNYTAWLEARQKRMADRTAPAEGSRANVGSRAGMDSHEPQSAAGQEQSANQVLRRVVSPIVSKIGPMNWRSRFHRGGIWVNW